MKTAFPWRLCIVRTVLAVVASLSLAGAARASSEVVVTDVSQGCFHYDHAETTFNRQGKQYKSNKGQTISQDELQELVKIIESSKTASQLDLASLGITPETVKAHYKDMRNAVLQDRAYITETVSTKDNYLFEYAHVCEEAKSQSQGWSTTHVKFSATINDPTISSSKIEVSSTHQYPWMLPWRVKVGERTWNTYSTALPLKLSKFADKKGPCASLLDGRQYWAKDFWSDREIWHSAGRKFDEDSAREIFEHLNGHEDAERLFTLEDCSRGLFNSVPESLLVELKAKTPSPISSVRWFNLLKAGKPTMSCTEMTKLFGKCDSLAQKQKWLVEWASVGNHRLKCTIAGNHCYEEDTVAISDYVLPAWRDAGMYGMPEMALTLRRGDKFCGTVFLSDSEERALVLDMDPGAGSHWLDRQKVSFHPREPNYIVVEKNGQYKYKTIKKNSPVLPKWAHSK